MGFNEKIYSTTLKLILLKSISEIFPEEEVQIQHTLSKGLYGELKNKKKISQEEIILMKKRMDEIIKSNLPINLVTDDIEDIRKKLKTIKRKDIVRAVNTAGWLPIKEYELDGYHDFFYEKTYSSTGDIHLYDLVSYSDGFILRFPLSKNSKELPLYTETPKLSLTQRECGIWDEMMDVSYIGSLNEKTMNGTIEELIRVSETLHEVKLVKLTNKIIANKKIKLVTIAGPSSSGKTTFSKRLMLYLKANRVFPILISLDSYYVGRENVPLDEYGKKDFENITALDLELLNNNIKDLIEGKKVEIPEYDFVTGKRKEHGTWMAIPENGILIIEGIHGLNEELTRDIPRNEKFKIYISCLTQLNIDMHNRIPTNEVRKIRRIVRDSLSRGTKVEETLAMWDSVRRGEEKYIFKFQEEADVMFDSNLVYELGVLKKHAMKELIKIKIESEYYEEAKRLLRFLYCFVDIDDKHVSDMSLLKEFIGGSYFYNY
ncbi:MAG: uridine kinase family protein [Fusobacteriaceae bacterium]